LGDTVKKVYVKEEVCIGCHLCEVYCQLQHAGSKDLVKAFKRAPSRPVSRLRVEEKGEISFSIRCQQCNDAPCVQACLTGALSRDPLTSLVKTDEERCIGCWTCILVCPFAAIGRDTIKKISVRCDLCQGEEVPVCVSNCPNEALVYLEVPDENPSMKSEMVDSIQ
jgi:carbon-monoxide dehydrogenase iron sulfur subunit